MAPESDTLLKEDLKKPIFPFIICVDNSTTMNKYLPTLKSYLGAIIKALKSDDDYFQIEYAYVSIISYNEEVDNVSPFTPIKDFKNISLKSSNSEKAHFSRAFQEAIFMIDKERVMASRDRINFYKPVVVFLMSRMDDTDAEIHAINKYAYDFRFQSAYTIDPNVHIIPFTDIKRLEQIGPHIFIHSMVEDMEDLAINIVEDAHICDSSSPEEDIRRENFDTKRIEKAEILLEEGGFIEYSSTKKERYIIRDPEVVTTIECNIDADFFDEEDKPKDTTNEESEVTENVEEAPKDWLDSDD